jgi:hypothetical protein
MRSRDGVTFRARDGVTSRDGVTLGPRNDVTSDVIGGLAPKLPVWKLVPRPCVGAGRGPVPGVSVARGGPRSDLKLAFSCAIAVVAYQEGLGRFRAAPGEFPLWRKSPSKKSEAVSRGAKTAEKHPLSSIIIRRGCRVTS